MITRDGAGIAVLRFGERPVPRRLAPLPAWQAGDASGTREAVEEAIRTARRLVVLGGDADVAAVLSRLMRSDRLDVEVAPLPTRLGARRALTGTARRIPLVRDDTGAVLVGAAAWLPPKDSAALRGEAVVDDTVLFDGEVEGVRIEPTAEMPGLRATVLGGRRRWVTGRAAQLGTTGAQVVRDGRPGAREVTRSTFYRHTTGWLRVG